MLLSFLYSQLLPFLHLRVWGAENCLKGRTKESGCAQPKVKLACVGRG